MEDVQAHHTNLLSQLYVEMLVTGNFKDEVRKVSSSTNILHPPQEAVALAALIKEQLQYQVLPLVEIPVPKSLVIPTGTYTLVCQTTDSVTLTPFRQKLHIPIFGGRLGGAQLWTGT